LLTTLRKRRKNGDLYERDEAVEAQIKTLVGLAEGDLIRACTTGKSSPDYVRSECVLHLLRRARGAGLLAIYEQLYKILIYRVLRQLPRPEAADGRTAATMEMRVRQYALDQFRDFLTIDARGYAERLDFFEVRFEAAVARLRADGRRVAWREGRRIKPLLDEETGEVLSAVEKAAGAYDPFETLAKNTLDYRIHLDEAIDALPPEQSEIVEMLRRQMPIDSKDPGVETIVKVTGLAEKTVRNRRDKAFAAIRRFLTQENAS
jgi:hypothetical protein